MKTTKCKLTRALLVTAVSMATFTGAFANGGQQYNSNDPIQINGYMQDEPAPTDHELESVRNELKKQENTIIINKEKSRNYKKLSKSTEKLADATEEMIEERKESQETIDKYNKKIECLMATGYVPGCEEYNKKMVKEQDQVKMVQAAPKVEATVEAPNSGDNFGETIKVLPYSGLTTFITDNEQLEAGLVGGIKVETNVSSRFSVGMGFNYTTFKTQDFANSGCDLAPYQGFDGCGYYDSFYDGGREIEYTNMNFDIYSKFFFVKNNRFRPYIGAGLGYNRTTLEYSNNNALPYDYNGYDYRFGKEEVSTSNINLELMLGSEINFTETIGANLELNYIRGLGNNLSSQTGIDPYLAPDQQRLEELSDELAEANILSMFASILIKF